MPRYRRDGKVYLTRDEADVRLLDQPVVTAAERSGGTTLPPSLASELLKWEIELKMLRKRCADLRTLALGSANLHDSCGHTDLARLVRADVIAILEESVQRAKALQNGDDGGER